jgi:hypothetical protein
MNTSVVLIAAIEAYLGWLNKWQVRSAMALRGRLLLLQGGVGLLVVLAAGGLLGLLDTEEQGWTGRWWQGSKALVRPLAATAFRSCRTKSQASVSCLCLIRSTCRACTSSGVYRFE